VHHFDNKQQGDGMIPKPKGGICRSLAIVILFLIIPGKGYSSNYPQWLQAYQEGTLALNDAYYGIGSSEFVGNSADDDSRRKSKDRALDELCYQLSVSIKSEFKENLKQKGQFTDQEVASSLFVSTQKVFSGIREKHHWTDPQHNLYWVMVIIDKTDADRQVKQQDFVKKVVERLEHNQREIAAGIKKMSVVLNQQMQFYKHRMNNFEKLLKTIDTKVGSAGDQTKAEYAGIKNEITKLGDKWNKQEEMLRDQNQKMAALMHENQSLQNLLKKSAGSEQMEALMAQNKALQDLFARVSHNIQSDHFLALTQDDVKNQSNHPGFTVKIAPLKGQGAYYYDGENIRFRVQASRNCYIKVIYLSSIGDDTAGETRMNTLLFPNVHDQDNYIAAGETTIIGKMGELVAQPPYGKDIVTVVASLKQFTDIDESLHRAAARGRYDQRITRNVSDAVRSRGIGVASRDRLTPSVSGGAFVSDTCFIITRKM
jgi:Domain of unknown function (DUF4384)